MGEASAGMALMVLEVHASKMAQKMYRICPALKWVSLILSLSAIAAILAHCATPRLFYSLDPAG